jgi:hypothetical protein
MNNDQDDLERRVITQAYIEKKNLTAYQTMLYETGQMALRFNTCEHAAYAENKDKYFCMIDPTRECHYGLACDIKEKEWQQKAKDKHD